ncbi:heat shock protein HSP 90 [Vairimorpha necatrix]|uniref:Heat shock protein HSP 90 n=1 Tax=Vairimorpha necatrix TaxID=6039 RepID=A0AAX4JGU1_9MICR
MESGEKKEQYEFDVNTNQLMDIIIKSVYSSSEIFLRELISNSSDASDKFRTLYLELKEQGLAVDDPSCAEIEVIPNLKNKTLTIKDNGIGMKKSDLISFIGTIASSGTRKFKEALEKKEAGNGDINHLIGQFGLGFYSSYLVAEKVDIITKHPQDEAYVWSSNGKENYTIEKYEGKEFSHGTSVILYIKEGNEEYLESDKIMSLIKKYSQYVLYPLFVYVEKEVEVKDEEEKEGDKKEDTDEPVVEEVKEKVVKKQKVIEKVRVNIDKPLWEKNIKNVPEEEIQSFYKSISGDWDNYLAVESWTIEGFMTMKLLLFIPKRSRMDMFSAKNKKPKNFKLFANNVFVTDDFGESIPEWMNFVVGIVSSNDISMNVSRELIQHGNVFKLIKKTVPQKLLDMITKLSRDEEKYNAFYKEFANCLKLAISEITDSQQEKIVNCLRYTTSKSEGKQRSFMEYVENMKENQNQIFVLTGLGKNQVEHNPILQAYKDYEVIFMHESVDEVMLRGLKKYKEKSVQRIDSEGVEIAEESNEKKEELTKEFENVLTKVKEVLNNQVEKVVLNLRLEDVPAVVTTTKYSNSAAMEAIMKSQIMAESNPLAAFAAASKKVLELNPYDEIMTSLKKLLEEDRQEEFKETTEILFNTVLVNCGFVVNDPMNHCKQVYRKLRRSG